MAQNHTEKNKLRILFSSVFFRDKKKFFYFLLPSSFSLFLFVKSGFAFSFSLSLCSPCPLWLNLFLILKAVFIVRDESSESPCKELKENKSIFRQFGKIKLFPEDIPDVGRKREGLSAVGY